MKYNLSAITAWPGIEENEWDIDHWQPLCVANISHIQNIIDLLIDAAYLRPTAKDMVDIENLGCGYRIIDKLTYEPLFDLVAVQS